MILNANLPASVEGFFIDMNIRNKKWLIFAGYNPKREYIVSFLGHMGKSLDKPMGDYENLILIGDFNSQMEEDVMNVFCETYNLKNLISEPTCYKNVQSPTLIDLILTNKPNSFQSSKCIETGISVFHKMTVSILNVHFKKLSPTKLKYRNYKQIAFKDELKTSLGSSGLDTITYKNFKNIFTDKLNKHAPVKEKSRRGNNAPFMNKTLSKAFMHRAKLKNKYNIDPTEENHAQYKKQRNYCVNLLNKVKKDYYKNIDLNIFQRQQNFLEKYSTSLLG